MLSQKPIHIQNHLVAGFDKVNFASYDIVELEYLAIICENLGVKGTSCSQFLQGADSEIERQKRWARINKLHNTGLIYDERDSENSVVVFHYHDDLPKLLFQKFSFLFKASYQPVAATILSIPLSADSDFQESSLSHITEFKLEEPVYLKGNTPYHCVLKKGLSGMILEITTVV
ncbi:hypothetical protein [Dyadobacter sp. 32]|uniref:hypothetical protein n=1 Tax=Dyadobacter sp. 32 TaxID=538966 RepID=UPI0011EBAB43